MKHFSLVVALVTILSFPLSSYGAHPGWNGKSESFSYPSANLKQGIQSSFPIQTEGFTIQNLEIRDLESAALLSCEERVESDFYAPGITPSCEEAFEGFYVDYLDPTKLSLKIEDPTTHQFMGLIIVPDLRSPALEISYALHPDFWGKGIMPKALRAVFPILLQDAWKKTGIKATTNLVNSKSKRVLEKLGFTELGINREKDGYDFFLKKEDFKAQ